MRRVVPFLLFGLAVGVACSSAELKVSPKASTTEPEAPDVEDPDADEGDGGSAADVAVKDAPITVVDAGCPPPARLTPADVPAGYLKAVKVTLDHMADGDSGDFNFPGFPKQGVRSLWINSEESYGDAGTEWGVTVKGIVKGYFQAATDIQIAVQETSPGSGVRKEDPFNRWLSLIFLDGELFQMRAIREGLSAYYTLYGCAIAPVHNALLYAEAEANAADRGIWGPQPPVHNDYAKVFAGSASGPAWIHNPICRPNPFKGQPYCTK